MRQEQSMFHILNSEGLIFFQCSPWDGFERRGRCSLRHVNLRRTRNWYSWSILGKKGPHHFQHPAGNAFFRKLWHKNQDQAQKIKFLNSEVVLKGNVMVWTIFILHFVHCVCSGKREKLSLSKTTHKNVSPVYRWLEIKTKCLIK